jgi:recombination associated protein RdgC
MFKNAIIYRLVKLPDEMADNMDAATFAPCGATQDKSIGWTPPREANGALVEAVHGRWFVKAAIETKAVPSSEIAKAVDAACEQIEQLTGRKPGKKEKRELKENALIELLPQAFPKRKDVMVMIDKVTGLIFIDATSQGAADDVVTLLVRAGLEVALVQTVNTPAHFMIECLLDEIDEYCDFVVGRECELKSTGEDAAKVTFKNHSLHTDEVRKHVTEGKLPTKLALSNYNDTSFVLTDGLTLRKIEFSVPDADKVEEADGFDANCVLVGAALTDLAAHLINEMGGLMSVDEPNEAPQTEAADTGDLYDKAVEIVMSEQKASISLIQRHLKIGYNAAARLLEQMETNGLVSPMQPSGQRNILASV